MPEIVLYVTGDEVATIYSPAASRFLAGLGDCETRRASTVDIGPDGQWYADLAPVGGPKLGPFPLAEHDAAISAEIAWIEANVLSGKR